MDENVITEYRGTFETKSTEDLFVDVYTETTENSATINVTINEAVVTYDAMVYLKKDGEWCYYGQDTLYSSKLSGRISLNLSSDTEYEYAVVLKGRNASTEFGQGFAYKEVYRTFRTEKYEVNPRVKIKNVTEDSITVEYSIPDAREGKSYQSYIGVEYENDLWGSGNVSYEEIQFQEENGYTYEKVYENLMPDTNYFFYFEAAEVGNSQIFGSEIVSTKTNPMELEVLVTEKSEMATSASCGFSIKFSEKYEDWIMK